MYETVAQEQCGGFEALSLHEVRLTALRSG
jgi:hypothetical protein